MEGKKLKSGIILVALFLITFIWWGSSRADPLFELGPSQVGSELSAGAMFTLSQRIEDKYDLTLGYITDQTFNRCGQPQCEWNVKAQIFFGGEYLVTAPFSDKLKLGIGPYYFQRPDRIGTSRFRVGLSVEYRFNRRLGLRVRHFSLAGSGPPLTICREGLGCQTNDWNTGQDSWLRAVWYF